MSTIRLQESWKYLKGHKDYQDNYGYQTGSEEQVILPVFIYFIFPFKQLYPDYLGKDCDPILFHCDNAPPLTTAPPVTTAPTAPPAPPAPPPPPPPTQLSASENYRICCEFINCAANPTGCGRGK